MKQLLPAMRSAYLALFLLPLPLALTVYAESWTDSQHVLSLIINETLRGTVSAPPPASLSPLLSRLSSLQSNPCPLVEVENSSADAARVGCCEPDDTRYLFNVRVERGKFIVFSNSTTNPKPGALSLPHIITVVSQKRTKRTMDVVERRSDDGEPTGCTSFFRGTLHVGGRSTVQNVYHASKWLY